VSLNSTETTAEKNEHCKHPIQTTPCDTTNCTEYRLN